MLGINASTARSIEIVPRGGPPLKIGGGGGGTPPGISQNDTPPLPIF